MIFILDDVYLRCPDSSDTKTVCWDYWWHCRQVGYTDAILRIGQTRVVPLPAVAS